MYPSKAHNDFSVFLDKKIKYLNPNFKEQLIEHFVSKDDFKSSLKNKGKLLKEVRDYLKISELPSGTSISSIKFFIVRGWTEKESLEFVNKFKKNRNTQNSPYVKRYWLNKGFSEEEAEIEVKKRRPTSKHYWINKGFSEEDAIQKVKEYQQIQSSKGNKNHFDGRWPGQKQYWINKGFSEEDAIQKVKDRQDTVSLKANIQKFGLRQGIFKFLNRQGGVAESNRLDILTAYKKCNRNINDFFEHLSLLKRSKGHASKESLLIFNPIYQTLRDKYTIFLGAYGGKEYKIPYQEDNKNKWYRYDFTILEKNIIIEYDGIYFHSFNFNKNLGKKNKYDPITEAKKQKMAEDKGFIFLRINSVDTYLEKIKKTLSFLIENDIILTESNFAGFPKFKRAIREIQNEKTQNRR